MHARRDRPTRARVTGVLLAALLAAQVTMSCNPDAVVKPVATAQGWSRVATGRPLPEPTAMVSGIVRILIGTTGMWLGLGTASASPGSLQKPGAWASTDDRNWSPIGVPVGPDETGSLVAAASDGSKALIGGAIGAGRQATPALWPSTDGWRWDEAIRLPVRTGTNGAVVRAITKGPGGWVATGGASEGGEATPMVWFSPDGTAWDLVPTGVASNTQSVWSVAASADRYVAVASVNDLDASGERLPVAVLSSANGREWQTHSTGDLFPGAVVSRSVVRIRDWFVFPIDCCGPDGRMLAVSRDGSSWAKGPSLDVLDNALSDAGAAPEGANAEVPSDTGADVVAVTTLGERQGRLVAWVGRDARIGAVETSPDQDLTAQTGTNGQVWVPIVLPPEPPGAATAAPDGYGTARLGTAGPTIVVDRPSHSGRQVSWSMGDGNWALAAAEIPPPDRRGFETVKALAANDQTVVAVGQATYLPAGPGDDTRPPEGRLWFSSGELLTWDEVIINGNIDDLRGVASDGERFVAVGVNGERPVLLVSRNGRQWLPAEQDQAIDEVFGVLGADMAAVSRPPTSAGGSEGQRALLDGELPTGVIRVGSLFVIRTEDGHLWSSPNGANWHQVELPASPEGSGSAGVLCAGDGVAVARPFRSTDGERWTSVPSLATDPVSVSCAVHGESEVLFVALGGAMEIDARLELLVGDQLRPRTLDDAHVGGAGRTGASWVLVGSRSGGGGHEVPAAWTSPDTTRWDPLRAAEDLVNDQFSGRLRSSLVWKDRLLLAGSHNDAGLVLAGPAS